MPQTAAIITRLTRLTETSIIVHWFTQDFGLVKTVAKGARRQTSPFAGKVDLFFGAEISYVKSRRSQLHSLREISITQWREGLRKDYAGMLLASYCCQLVETAVEPEHPDEAIYSLLLRALDHLASTAPSQRTLRHFEKELCRVLGIYQQRTLPHLSLREILGTLPSMRSKLLEILPDSVL